MYVHRYIAEEILGLNVCKVLLGLVLDGHRHCIVSHLVPTYVALK
jgi:hypothetical protein